MPKGRDFSKELWDGIYAARARLEAYKLKIQPYPDYPEEETPKPSEQVLVHRHSNMSRLESDLLQQTARKTDYLLKKLNEKQTKEKYIIKDEGGGEGLPL